MEETDASVIRPPSSRRDVADCHILVESRYSQFGEVKPLYFEQSKNSSPDRFAAYRDKIVHIVVEDKPEGVGCELGWKHEWHVRDAILRGLDSDEIKNCGAMSSRELRDDDILMISDADEVPRGTVVKKLKAKWPVGRCLLTLYATSQLFDPNLYIQLSTPNVTEPKD